VVFKVTVPPVLTLCAAVRVTVPTWVAGAPFTERHTVKLVSLFELSVQVKRILLVERIVAIRLDGGESAKLVPLNAVVNVGFTGSLLLTTNKADNDPRVAGTNVTPIAQLEPAARLAPHAFVCTNSPVFAPPIQTALIASGADPVLDSVTV
jgi:hypothetical protein